MLELELEYSFNMGKYKHELKKAMEMLASHPKTIFLGQAIEYPGTAMQSTLENIEKVRLLEMPVEEDLQMGVSIGMALAGSIPISIFPRWNFLLLAVNQIVNHLDKLSELTQLAAPPKVIIRTGIGSINPLDPGPQHKGDFTQAFKHLCNNIDVIRLDDANIILPVYEYALNRKDGKSSLIIEWSDKYNE
jgi:pyruvate/2-oxoglutarate/acetoin dehydrogenase E1 component